MIKHTSQSNVFRTPDFQYPACVLLEPTVNPPLPRWSPLPHQTTNNFRRILIILNNPNPKLGFKKEVENKNNGHTCLNADNIITRWEKKNTLTTINTMKHLELRDPKVSEATANCCIILIQKTSKIWKLSTSA